MEYITLFNRQLCTDQIAIRNSYVDQSNGRLHDKSDVVTDLNESNQLMAVACLPIARQIVTHDRKISLQLPKLGDLFCGVVNHPVIERVTFIINNYTEEIFIEGQLCQKGSLSLWCITELPIILVNIVDYEHVNMCVQIELTGQYNLHQSNQDVFKACYGYVHTSLKPFISEQVVTQIPLLNQMHILETVCGIWTVIGGTTLHVSSNDPQL